MQFGIQLGVLAKQLLPVRDFASSHRFGITGDDILHGQSISARPSGDLGGLQISQEDFPKQLGGTVAVDRLAVHGLSSLSPRRRGPSGAQTERRSGAGPVRV